MGMWDVITKRIVVLSLMVLGLYFMCVPLFNFMAEVVNGVGIKSFSELAKMVVMLVYVSIILLPMIVYTFILSIELLRDIKGEIWVK